MLPVYRTCGLSGDPFLDAILTECMLTVWCLERILEYTIADRADELLVDVALKAIQVVAHYLVVGVCIARPRCATDLKIPNVRCLGLPEMSQNV